MADPTELERILKARGIKPKPVSPPTPPPKPVSKSELELLLESRGIKPKPVPKNEPEQKPASQVSGASPKRDFLERLAADNMPDAPPSPYVSSAPYYLARPTGDTSTNFVPVLDETLLRDEPRKIETRYDPMGMPYDVDAEDPSRPINDTSLEAVADAPFGERPLSVPQALGLSDRSTSVRPTRDAFTPFDLPEDLNGQELLEIALDPNMDSNLRRKAQYALSRLAPKSLQSLPGDKQPHTASPFVNDIETELKNLRVDPLWLVSGDKAARDEPAKMLADLNALYRKRLIRTAPGKNYTSDLDVPKEELAAINAKASEMAENKYKEIADGVGGFNLVRMKDAQTHIDNARKNAADFIGAPGGEEEGKGTLFAPFFAALSPGVYTVNDVYSTQQGHPVVRREGMGAFSMRAPTSTAIGSWLFNPESTWEFGGEHGWGGEQHMRDITYGYQLGDSMEHMRDVTREAFQSGLSPGGANMMAHVLVDIPTLGVMMVEPDMYALPGLATLGMAKLARPVVTGVNTASDILKELKVLESAIEATTTGDELDALLRASVSEPISTKSTAARSVYAEAQNYIADTASDVPLSEMNPLHNVTNATLRKLKAGDIDEPGEFIPTEAKQVGQQHAEVDRVADMSGARADELDTAYQVMHSQAMLDDLNVRDVINDIDRLAGNNDVQTLRAEMDTARQAADIAAADLANLARFNMARMGVENIDMPGMIRTGNFRQVLAQLYSNRGELFSILRKAGEGFDKLDPAKQAARIADLQAKVAAAKRTLIDNVGDIAVARKVAEYAAAQDTIAAKAAEIGKRLKEHAKAAGKGTARVTPDQVAEARKAVGRQQKTWERMDDLALRQQIARKVHTVTTEMYKPLMLKAVRKHIDAVERFIANGGPAKQKEVGSPIYASVVNDLDEIDVDKYIDELQTRLGKDVVESTISSPIGKILDELAGKANKSGPLVKLSGSDYDRLQLFEDAVHAENFRVEKLGPQARAEVMLNTVKEWKDLGGKAWVNVFRGKESLSTPLFQLYHRLTRRFDAAGGSDVGHMSARLQEHVRRTLDRGRAVLGEIDDVGLGAKLVAPTDGGTQLTGLDAIEEFITTKRRYGGAIWNQGDLTIHQRGFLYLRSILDTDFAADNVIVFAIAGAPAKSFDPVVMSVIGDAIRSLKSAIKSASNADEAMVLARQAVRNAMLRQKGATDSDEVVRHIVARAFAYAAVQYDSALDFQRLFGPGISSESARVLNWMMSPATSNLALGSADAAFNTAAHLGLPLKGDMRGEWRRAFGVLADSRAVSTELVKRAQVEGYGLFVPSAVRTAMHEENLKIAKEMTEFSRNNKNSIGSLLLRLVDHIRFQGIFGWLPHAWLPFGNLFGGASWLMLEKGGAQRAGQFVFSNAPAMVPWVGLRGPGGSPGLQQIAYDTAAAHSIATRVFDPKVAKFLFKGDLDEVIALPTGERTTIGRLLREAEEDGTDTFLNSDEMRHIIREQRKLREGSPKPGTKPGEPVGPASVPDGPPDASGIPGARLPLDPMDAPVMAKYEETVTEADAAAPPDVVAPKVLDMAGRLPDEFVNEFPDWQRWLDRTSPDTAKYDNDIVDWMNRNGYSAIKLSDTAAPVRVPQTIVPPTPAPGAMDSVPPVKSAPPADPAAVREFELMNELKPKLSSLADAMRADGHTAEQISVISDKAIKVAVARNNVDTIIDAISPYTQVIMGARSALRTPDGRWEIIGEDGVKFLDGAPNFIDEIRGMLREALHVPRDVVDRGIASFTGGYDEAINDLVMSAGELKDGSASKLFDIVNHKSASAPNTPSGRMSRFADNIGNAFSEMNESSAKLQRTIDEFTPGTDAYNARKEAEANSPEALERRRIAKDELDAEYAKRESDRAAEVERIRKQMFGEADSSSPVPNEPRLPDWMMNPDPIRELGEAETPPPWTLDMPPVSRTAATVPPGGPGQPSVPPPGWMNPPPAAARAATPGAPPPRMPPPPPTPPTPPTPPSPAPGAPGSPGPGGTHSPLNVAKRAANALGMFIKGPWTEDFARWVENLESRARLSYYVGLRLEGNSRMATRERLHRNLGNWSTGLSNSEAQFWGRYFSVYRWTRIKMRHMGETLAWSLTKPDVVNPRDIVFNNTPLGRLTRLGKLRNNIPNLFDWDDSTDKLSDDEQFDAWGRRTLPWWEHSGVWLGARPALEWEKRMKTLSGREVSFVEMQLISLQALDELYLLNAFAQAAIATTLELSPLETNYAGIGTGDDAGLAHALSRAAIDEFSRNIDKKWAEATRDMLNAAAGNDNPENFRGVLVPRDQHVAVKTIARLNPAIVDYGFIQEDENGELRVDGVFWPALELMVLQLPMIDDLARATAHGVNVYNDPSLAHSLGLIVGDYTSLYREVGFDPTKDHDYAVRERVAQLKEALIRADRDANSDDDRARKRSGQ